jgi:hypothetical protein
MQNKPTIKEQAKEIENKYISNRNFLDNQFKRATDKNIFSILVQNINIIEEDDSFTELDLMESIKNIIEKYPLFENVEEFVEYSKELQYTWIDAKRTQAIGELQNEIK